MKVHARIILISACCLSWALPGSAYEFQGKGNKQAWMQACELSTQSGQLFQNGEFDQAFVGFYKSIELYPDDYRQSTLQAINIVKSKLGTAADGATTTPNKWQTYKNESSGISIQHPEGWTVSSDPKTGQIDAIEEAGARLTILPFFTEQKVEPSAAPSIFNTFIHLLDPNVNWAKAQRIGDTGLRSQFESATTSGVAAISFADTATGTSSYVVITKAPKDVSKLSASVFASMLSSLRISAPELPAQANTQPIPATSDSPEASDSPPTSFGTQPASNGLPPTPFNGYNVFTDPDQNSFTVEVPVGWKVEGGMVRARAIEPRPWVKVVSPDGLITAFIGDAKIPSYSIPTALGMQLGFYPGKWYQNSMVRAYTPARKYIEQYARDNLKTLFSDIRLVEEHNHPEVAASVNGTVGASRSEAASIKLTANYQNIPAVAYYLGATKATVGYGAGMWWVSLIAGEVGPADRDEAGLYVILHMLKTFHMNPEWQSQATNTAGAVSRQYTEASQQASNAISKNYWNQQAANESIHQSYWNRQASQDRAANNFSNYIRGQENVVDPQTGTKYQVEYGPQYHWINPTSDVVTGTQYSGPGPEWRQLLSVP